MKKAFVFPGQGAQFVGMGLDLYENNEKARQMFERANEVLGFRITDIMFHGTDEELKQTRVTQPAVFLHSVIEATIKAECEPDAVAGHSLGEFSALVLQEHCSLKMPFVLFLPVRRLCRKPANFALQLWLPSSVWRTRKRSKGVGK